MDPKAYRAAAEKLDWAAVKADIKTLLTTSQVRSGVVHGELGTERPLAGSCTRRKKQQRCRVMTLPP